MQKRRLGRTGLQVSVIGFGGWPLRNLRKRDGADVVGKAFELGINFFDTGYPDWLDSAEKIGLGLEGVRDQCILSLKIPIHRAHGQLPYLPVYGQMPNDSPLLGKREVKTLLRQGLHYLKTDRIDILEIHYGAETLPWKQGSEKALRLCEGFLEAFREARREGIVDFIGISGHHPYLVIEAIRTGQFDVFHVPLNIATTYAADELIPLGREMDVGVTIMKPFGGETVGYAPSEFRMQMGKDRNEIAKTALRFVLAQDIDSVNVGFTSTEEVEAAVEVAEGFKGPTREEEMKARARPEEPYCRNCGFPSVCDQCMPCPEFLWIPAILRLDNLYTRFGLEDWARDKYQKLATKVDCCTKCGECEPRCPYGVSIIEMLQKADKRLRVAELKTQE